jgi:hypothetical protein
MKKIATSIIVGMVTLFFLVTGVNAAEMEGEGASKTIKIVGATVSNLQGVELGNITEVERDSETGFVSFAILSHGGKLIPVPINALTFSGDNKATLDMSKETLASAPGYETGNKPDMSDRKWSEAVHRYYGIRPYWEEERMEEEPYPSRKDPWDPWKR